MNKDEENRKGPNRGTERKKNKGWSWLVVGWSIRETETVNEKAEKRRTQGQGERWKKREREKETARGDREAERRKENEKGDIREMVAMKK